MAKMRTPTHGRGKLQSGRKKAGKKAGRSTKDSVATPSIPLRPGRNGGMLQSGNPGNKGGGRSPEWLMDFCEDLLKDPRSRAAVEKILMNPRHPGIVNLWKAVADRAYGKPRQDVAHSGEVTLEMILARSFTPTTPQIKEPE